MDSAAASQPREFGCVHRFKDYRDGNNKGHVIHITSGRAYNYHPNDSNCDVRLKAIQILISTPFVCIPRVIWRVFRNLKGDALFIGWRKGKIALRVKELRQVQNLQNREQELSFKATSCGKRVAFLVGYALLEQVKEIAKIITSPVADVLRMLTAAGMFFCPWTGVHYMSTIDEMWGLELRHIKSIDTDDLQSFLNFAAPCMQTRQSHIRNELNRFWFGNYDPEGFSAKSKELIREINDLKSLMSDKEHHNLIDFVSELSDPSKNRQKICNQCLDIIKSIGMDENTTLSFFKDQSFGENLLGRFKGKLEAEVKKSAESDIFEGPMKLLSTT
ncbi:hypothetical protein SCG7109_AC_00090 [Chlamydiales bacterium SCGC AG-110-M15]|nr:hypothetical protein SCG7109_AC_00090 [Chlamydiales bacterium SCGC AG-110-M15]